MAELLLDHNGRQLKVDRFNYKDVAKHLCLSYSIFCRMLGLRPPQPISGDVALYDIETDMDTKKFILGVVNNLKFDDPLGMVKEIAKHKVVAGFNNFRFDNEYLFRLCPELFETRYMSGFELHKVKGCMNLDLLPAFMLWKPFESTHQLNRLAEMLGIKRKYGLADVGKKCGEDVKILTKFWPYARQIYDFVETNFHIDPETLSSTYHKRFGYSKLRRWFLQSWMMQEGTYPELVKRDDPRHPTYYYMHRKGFFRDVNVFDVKSAYPNTAVKLNCGLYKPGDFAEYEAALIVKRVQNPDISEFIKWVCNATIGDFNYRDGLLYDKKIMTDVWLHFRKVMQKWVRKIKKKNILYSMTDCVFTQLDSVPPIDGYDIDLKHRFKWLAIFNQQRLIGLTNEGRIHRVHFNRPVRLKLFDELDRVIDGILRTDPVEFFKRPGLEIDLKNLGPAAFAVVIFKRDEVCRNVEYLELWPDLKFGLNDVYLGRRGITTDPKKISHRRYNKWVKYYLNLYRGLKL